MQRFILLSRAFLSLTVMIVGINLSTVQAKDQVFSNSLGMGFVLIPAGSFIMGSPASEPARDPHDSERQHKVTLTHPFYMQTTEVTCGQWRQVMGRRFLFRWRSRHDRPVVKVSWYDVQEFIKKLNALGEGTYRLPTEAEWEYAARAGTTTVYFWGDTIDCAKAMYANSRHKVDTCREYVRNHQLPSDGPAPVKSYPPNPWGLFDMHGNVWEWVQDQFAKYPDHPISDPLAKGSEETRVRRGGSWFSAGNAARAANRAYAHPASRLATTGFRLVKVVEP